MVVFVLFCVFTFKIVEQLVCLKQFVEVWQED